MVFEILDLRNALPDDEHSRWGNAGFSFIQGDIVKEIDDGGYNYYYVVGYQWNQRGAFVILEELYWDFENGFETFNEEYVELPLNDTINYSTFEVEVRGEQRVREEQRGWS